MNYLVVNAGSSSLKYAVYTADAQTLERGVYRLADAKHCQLHSTAQMPPGEGGFTLSGNGVGEQLAEVIEHLLDRLEANQISFGAAGHRVVHGGPNYTEAVWVDDGVLAHLQDLISLAPLHQPCGLLAIAAVRKRHPAMPQLACFDTAFHAHLDPVNRIFAIPSDLGIVRYGFHGLSYQYLVERTARNFPASAMGKIVAAQIGSGVSLCAIHGGKSRDTTMGFTALDGMPMSTRSGALDPGALLHLARRMGDLDKLEDILYRQSGLLGISGISSDTRQLLLSEAPSAKLAIDYFVRAIGKGIAAMATSIEGLDTLIFSGGIGENQPEIRALILDQLAWLGLEMDPDKNHRNEAQIHTSRSSAAILVLPTDEESVIYSELRKRHLN